MAESAPQAVPLNNCEQIITMIDSLQTSLRQNLPDYESLLHRIHVALSKDEECAILLSSEQQGVICAGLSKKKGLVITADTVKKPGNKLANGKKMSDVSLEDLGG